MEKAIKTFQLPLLSGSANYIEWSMKTSAYFKKEGLYATISPGFTNPISETDLATNDKALATLQLLCESGPMLHINGQTLAKNA